MNVCRWYVRLKQRRSPSTVNSDVQILMKLLRWAHRKGHRSTLRNWAPKARSSIRKVPISRELADELAALPREAREEAYVFPGKTLDKPIVEIKRAFQTAVMFAKITRNGKPVRITPYTHSCRIHKTLLLYF